MQVDDLCLSFLLRWDVLHTIASVPSEMYVFFAEHYNDAVNGLITTLTQLAVCNDIHPSA